MVYECRGTILVLYDGLRNGVQYDVSLCDDLCGGENDFLFPSDTRLIG